MYTSAMHFFDIAFIYLIHNYIFMCLSPVIPICQQYFYSSFFIVTEEEAWWPLMKSLSCNLTILHLCKSFTSVCVCRIEIIRTTAT